MQATEHAVEFPTNDAAGAAPQCPRPWLLSAVLALGCALAVGTAAAQGFPGGGRPVIDTNNDGVLDEQELRAARLAVFERADADADGYLTRDESRGAGMVGDVERRSRGFGAGFGRRFGNAETAEERFERLDKDADGRVSEQEFLDAPNPLLRFDADGDGRVTRDEIEDARKRMRRPLL